MSKPKETHVFQCSDRMVTLTIKERKDHVIFDLRMSQYGWSTDRDDEAFLQWLKPLGERYENDPRPIVQRHPLTGQIAIIGGNAVQGTLIVIPAEGNSP